MAMTEQIDVEVAYASPAQQLIIALRVALGTTAEQALAGSGLAERVDGIDLTNVRLGVFGKAVSHTRVLRAGDRVEVYRPLLADPKEVRRRRARTGK
jgi:putative ubiquitin-RnfH superfamily antitoxin RatB of RatAB toxin-antitoxin module